MKKILLPVFLLLISYTAFSQLTKGALLLEGTGNLSFGKSDEEYSGTTINENKNNQLWLRPGLGIMLSEKWMLGSAVDYTHQSSVSEFTGGNLTQTTEQTSNSFGLNVFVRRYAQLNDKLYFTATLNAGGGLGKLKVVEEYEGNDPETTDFDTYQANLSVVPGLTYFISNKWAITGSIGQLYANFSWRNPEDEDEATKNFNSSAGLNFRLNTFSVGLQYFLRNGAE